MKKIIFILTLTAFFAGNIVSAQDAPVLSPDNIGVKQILPAPSAKIDVIKRALCEQVVCEIDSILLICDTVYFQPFGNGSYYSFTGNYYDKQGLLRKYFSESIQNDGSSSDLKIVAYYNTNGNLVYMDCVTADPYEGVEGYYYVDEGKIIDFSFNISRFENELPDEEKINSMRPVIGSRLKKTIGGWSVPLAYYINVEASQEAEKNHYNIEPEGYSVTLTPIDSTKINRKKTTHIDKMIAEINAMKLRCDTIQYGDSSNFYFIYFDKKGRLRKYYSKTWGYDGAHEYYDKYAYYNTNGELIYYKDNGGNNCEDWKSYYYVDKSRIVDFWLEESCGCCEDGLTEEEITLRRSIVGDSLDLPDYLHSDSLQKVLKDWFRWSERYIQRYDCKITALGNDKYLVRQIPQEYITKMYQKKVLRAKKQVEKINAMQLKCDTAEFEPFSRTNNRYVLSCMYFDKKGRLRKCYEKIIRHFSSPGNTDIVYYFDKDGHLIYHSNGNYPDYRNDYYADKGILIDYEAKWQYESYESCIKVVQSIITNSHPEPVIGDKLPVYDLYNYRAEDVLKEYCSRSSNSRIYNNN